MMAVLRYRLWVEWIDSASNPSDGLSRAGLSDALFGHCAEVASSPAWTTPDLFAKQCLAQLQGRQLPAEEYFGI